MTDHVGHRHVGEGEPVVVQGLAGSLGKGQRDVLLRVRGERQHVRHVAEQPAVLLVREHRVEGQEDLVEVDAAEHHRPGDRPGPAQRGAGVPARTPVPAELRYGREGDHHGERPREGELLDAGPDEDRPGGQFQDEAGDRTEGEVLDQRVRPPAQGPEDQRAGEHDAPEHVEGVPGDVADRGVRGQQQGDQEKVRGGRRQETPERVRSGPVGRAGRGRAAQRPRSEVGPLGRGAASCTHMSCSSLPAMRRPPRTGAAGSAPDRGARDQAAYSETRWSRSAAAASSAESYPTK